MSDVHVTPLQALALADITIQARYPSTFPDGRARIADDIAEDDPPYVSLRRNSGLIEASIKTVMSRPVEVLLDGKGCMHVERTDAYGLAYARLHWVPDPRWPEAIWKFEAYEIDGINEDAYDPREAMARRLMESASLSDFLEAPSTEAFDRLIHSVAEEVWA